MSLLAFSQNRPEMTTSHTFLSSYVSLGLFFERIHFSRRLSHINKWWTRAGSVIEVNENGKKKKYNKWSDQQQVGKRMTFWHLLLFQRHFQDTDVKQFRYVENALNTN